MKLNISKKQWDGLSIEEKNNYLGFSCKDRTYKNLLFNGYLSIGRMIEYLGDDLAEIHYYKDDKKFGIRLLDGTYFSGKKLIDIGWKASKYKLKQ